MKKYNLYYCLKSQYLTQPIIEWLLLFQHYSNLKLDHGCDYYILSHSLIDRSGKYFTQKIISSIKKQHGRDNECTQEIIVSLPFEPLGLKMYAIRYDCDDYYLIPFHHVTSYGIIVKIIIFISILYLLSSFLDVLFSHFVIIIFTFWFRLNLFSNIHHSDFVLIYLILERTLIILILFWFWFSNVSVLLFH